MKKKKTKKTYLFDVLLVGRPLDVGEQRRDAHRRYGGRGETRDGRVRGHHRVRGHQQRDERVRGVRGPAAVQDGGGRGGHGAGGQHGRDGPRVQRGRGGLRQRERARERQPRGGHGRERRSCGRLGLAVRYVKRKKKL